MPAFGSLTRIRFHLTSSLVNSRPECHCTPLRRLSLYCVASPLISHDSARRGWISSLSLYSVSPSQTFQTESYWSRESRCPSRPDRSLVKARRRVPPFFGAAEAGVLPAAGVEAAPGAEEEEETV